MSKANLESFRIDDINIEGKVVPVGAEMLVEYAKLHRLFSDPARAPERAIKLAADLEQAIEQKPLLVAALAALDAKIVEKLAELEHEDSIDAALIQDVKNLRTKLEETTLLLDSTSKDTINTLAGATQLNLLLTELNEQVDNLVEVLPGSSLQELAFSATMNQVESALTLDDPKTLAARGNFNEYVRQTYRSTEYPNGFNERIVVIADLSGQTIGNGIRTTDLEYVDLSGSKMTDTSFIKCNLNDANFCDTDVASTTFDRSDLMRTDFRGSDILGTSFFEVGGDDGEINYEAGATKGIKFSFANVKNLSNSNSQAKLDQDIQESVHTLNRAKGAECSVEGTGLWSYIQNTQAAKYTVSRGMIDAFVMQRASDSTLTLNKYLNKQAGVKGKVDTTIAIEFTDVLDGFDLAQLGDMRQCKIVRMPISTAELKKFSEANRDHMDYDLYGTPTPLDFIDYMKKKVLSIDSEVTFEFSMDQQKAPNLEDIHKCFCAVTLAITEEDLNEFNEQQKANEELTFDDFCKTKYELTSADTQLIIDIGKIDRQNFDFKGAGFSKSVFTNVQVGATELKDYQHKCFKLQEIIRSTQAKYDGVEQKIEALGKIFPGLSEDRLSKMIILVNSRIMAKLNAALPSFQEYIAKSIGIKTDPEKTTSFDLRGENFSNSWNIYGNYQNCRFKCDFAGNQSKTFSDALQGIFDDQNLDPTYVLGSSVEERSRPIVNIEFSQDDLTQYMSTCCGSDSPTKSFVEYIRDTYPQDPVLTGNEKIVPTLAKDTSIKGFDFKNGIFNGCNFANATFSKVTANGAKFEQGACLEGVVIEGSSFQNTSFDTANMFSTKFSNSTLDHCSMVRTNLMEGNLYRTIITNSNLDSINLERGVLKRTVLKEDTTLNYANMKGVTLSYATLTGVKAKGAIFEKAVMEQVRIIGGDFSGAIMSGLEMKDSEISGDCIMHGIEARRARFSNVDMEHVDLSDADLRDVILRKVKLEHAELRNTNLEDATIRLSSISDSMMQNARMLHSDIKGLVLKNVQAQGLDLSDSRIAGMLVEASNLEKAVLRGVDAKKLELRKVVLHDADLRDSKLVDFIMEDIQAKRLLMQNIRLVGEAKGVNDLDGAQLNVGSVLAITGEEHVIGKGINEHGEEVDLQAKMREDVAIEEARGKSLQNTAIGQFFLQATDKIGDMTANMCTALSKFCREPLMGGRVALIVGVIIGIAVAAVVMPWIAPLWAVGAIGTSMSMACGAAIVGVCAMAVYKLNEKLTPNGGAAIAAGLGAIAGMGGGPAGATLGATAAVTVDIAAQKILGFGIGNVIAYASDIVASGARSLSDDAKERVRLHEVMVVQDQAREQSAIARSNGLELETGTVVPNLTKTMAVEPERLVLSPDMIKQAKQIMKSTQVTKSDVEPVVDLSVAASTVVVESASLVKAPLTTHLKIDPKLFDTATLKKIVLESDTAFTKPSITPMVPGALQTGQEQAAGAA